MAFPAATIFTILPAMVGMRNWCYATNDTPRSKFLHGNAGIAAHTVGIEKLRAEHISECRAIWQSMIKTPYLCPLKFNLAPTVSIVRTHLLDDLNDLGACGPAFLLELFESSCGSSSST